MSYTPHSRLAVGGGGKGFARSLGIPVTVMIQFARAVVLDLMRQGFRRMVVVNGHVENLIFGYSACGGRAPSPARRRYVKSSTGDAGVTECTTLLADPAAGSCRSRRARSRARRSSASSSVRALVHWSAQGLGEQERSLWPTHLRSSQ